MRNVTSVTLAFLCSLVLAADANAQRGRGGLRPPTEEKQTEDSAEPAGRGRGGRFSGIGGTPEEQPAGRGRGRGGRFGGGQPPAGGPAAGGGRFGGGESTNKLFAAIDADGDGVITKAEMEDAILAFARLDEDKDGKLTKEEAGATGGGGHGHGGGRGRFGGNQSEPSANQTPGRGRGGFGRGLGLGQRPELEQPADGKEPASTGKKPSETGTSKSPFDDE